MYKVTVEGLFESNIGSGQKKYYDFKYEIEIARFSEKGLETHILRRYLPYYIKKDKKNASRLFSKVKNFVITDIQKLDKECYLKGKDIATLNELEIQDLACLYDLYSIPVTGVLNIQELRKKAMLAYMEYVLKVPMKTPEEKSKLDFFEVQEDGSYELKLDSLEIEIVDDFFKDKVAKTVKKKSIADFIGKLGVTVANGVLSATGNNGLKVEVKNPDEGNVPTTPGMPTASQLLNQNQ